MLSRETQPIGCVCIYRWETEREKFILRSWLTQFWRLASPESAGRVGRLETQERADVIVQVWRPSATEFTLAWGRSVFLFCPAGDEAHIHYGGQSALLRVHWYKMLNVYLIQNQSHRNIQNNVWPHIWAPGLAKLTHKINSHSRILARLIRRKREKTNNIRNEKREK